MQTDTAYSDQSLPLNTGTLSAGSLRSSLSTGQIPRMTPLPCDFEYYTAYISLTPTKLNLPAKKETSTEWCTTFALCLGLPGRLCRSQQLPQPKFLQPHLTLFPSQLVLVGEDACISSFRACSLDEKCTGGVLTKANTMQCIILPGKPYIYVCGF